eukprot:CAMPEP_0177637210 /NCGR_PEP_ID=MMETSP0447-20121125/4852_1 /TAXON_ID=0 /ORGANISM="Stygamoeba regulata, Strain BSH-02190019" /LENGTH=344 /DNA_ID=CAMNT_0019139127 /DNA_START=40 /DNA_END=1070 /DNA_ORIENTATION=-
MAAPSKVKGTIFILWLVFTAYFGVVLVQGWTLLLLLAGLLPLYRFYNDWVSWFWFHVPITGLEWLLGLQVHVSGDIPLDDERALILMNHPTRLDWMFFWSFLKRYGRLHNEKIILKDDLKKIPGFGWAMQFFCFLFLSRSWDRDEPHVNSWLDRFTGVGYPLQLLIFPEGTNISPTTRERTIAFAEKNGLKAPRHLLLPRVKGTVHLLKHLRGHIDTVWDVTIGYSGKPEFSEKSLLTGAVPDEVHFHLSRIPISEVPAEEDEAAAWLARLWDEKDDRLEKFYSKATGRSMDAATSRRVPLPWTTSVVVVAWFLLLAVIFFILWSSWWGAAMYVAANILFVVLT